MSSTTLELFGFALLLVLILGAMMVALQVVWGRAEQRRTEALLRREVFFQKEYRLLRSQLISALKEDVNFGALTGYSTEDTSLPADVLPPENGVNMPSPAQRLVQKMAEARFQEYLDQHERGPRTPTGPGEPPFEG